MSARKILAATMTCLIAISVVSSATLVRAETRLVTSVEGITEFESADRIVSGMVGNHEALRRFGVIITETSLSAKLMEMGIKGGSRAATEQQKVLAELVFQRIHRQVIVAQSNQKDEPIC